MSYRKDIDLEFLQYCNNEELKNLFEVLTIDPKDNIERITSTLKISDEYKMYGEDYHKYWERIAEELQLFGGNTIFNIFRKGTGILYREIALDVAKHIKAPINKNGSIENIEDAITMKLTLDLLGKMPEEQIKEFFEEMEDNNIKQILTEYKDIPWKTSSVFIVRQIFKAGKFTSYKMTLKIVNLMWRKLFGRGLSFAANRTLTKTLGSIVGGPLSVVLNTWLIMDIAGPAMRVTVPTVLLVSCLRKEVKLRKY